MTMTELYKRVFDQFGLFEIDCFGPDSFRVWVRDWHFRKPAVSGALVGYGITPEAALQRLIDFVSEPGLHIAKGSTYKCDYCRKHFPDCD